MTEKSISEFLSDEYKEFAMYSIEGRAMPSVIDGFKPTQRKVIHISNQIWKTGGEKTLKVFQLAGKVASDAFYHHGNTSLENSIVTMAQKFKNNAALLEEDGQYGSLRSPQPGAPRYIGTKLNENFRLIYKDFELLNYKEEEGETIEPEFFLPIIPTVLLNGSSGIAVGFAAKDTLANLFSGVFIMADAPYKIGDVIVLDTAERGEVTHIGIRSTRILTRDDVEVTIPNSVMGNTKIINESGGPHEKFRCRVSVGVAYGSDIDKVRKILMAIALADKQVRKDPEPRVRFRLFGASSLDFDLLVWITNPVLRGSVVDSLNCAIYQAFNEHNIEIPYSKQDLYIKELPSGVGDK